MISDKKTIHTCHSGTCHASQEDSKTYLFKSKSSSWLCPVTSPLYRSHKHFLPLTHTRPISRSPHLTSLPYTSFFWTDCKTAVPTLVYYCKREVVIIVSENNQIRLAVDLVKPWNEHTIIPIGAWNMNTQVHLPPCNESDSCMELKCSHLNF